MSSFVNYCHSKLIFKKKKLLPDNIIIIIYHINKFEVHQCSSFELSRTNWGKKVYLTKSERWSQTSSKCIWLSAGRKLIFRYCETQAQPKQCKCNGLVSPTKPSLPHSLLSLSLSLVNLAVYSAELKQQLSAT